MTKSFYRRLLNIFKASKGMIYTYYGEKHTYAECYSNMRRFNYYLHKKRQKKIVLYGSKNFPVYSAIYSIILSGNIWIPVTPGIPENRLMAMLGVLMPDVIIFEGELPQDIRRFCETHTIELLKLDDILKEKREADFTNPDFAPDEWAYIMFTSGSTGVPKGVPMTHENYINFVENALEILPFKKGEIFSDYHDFAFDISIFYLFCAPLTESAIAPIKKKEERMFPLSHIQNNNITVWSSVPSVISCIQRFRPSEKSKNKIKIMFLCGEPFSLDVLRYCYKYLDIPHVYNFYGLTETGVENFYHDCSPEDLDRYKEKDFVPVGKPLKKNNIRITEDKELFLGGCQVTPGYLGNVGQENFEEIECLRWYHTGDIVELYKGVYFCKGRVDSQVKISGHRIELMDIEVHIRKHEAVKEAVCFVEGEDDIKRLFCAIEKLKEKELDIRELTRWLKSKLPDYMVPKRFFELPQMPVNKNGKIDRKAIRHICSEKLKAIEGASLV